MADFELDMSEVREVAVELERLPSELARHAVPVMKKAAQNIKTAIQEDFQASSNRGFQKIARHVSYDEISDGPAGFETDIGVDKGEGGNLANLAVYGSYKGGGTHLPPDHFAELELPQFEEHLSALVDRIWP